jgi:hypothetical protein
LVTSCWAERAELQPLEIRALLLGGALQIIHCGLGEGRRLPGRRGEGPGPHLGLTHYHPQSAPANLHLARRGHFLLDNLGQVHLGGQNVGMHHGPGAKQALGDLQVLRRGCMGLFNDLQVLLGQLQTVIGLGHLEEQLLAGAQHQGTGRFPAQLRLLAAQLLTQG